MADLGPQSQNVSYVESINSGRMHLSSQDLSRDPISINFLQCHISLHNFITVPPPKEDKKMDI